MKYLKTFELYSDDENIGSDKIFEEKCPDCNCNCNDCDCTDCECPNCCKKCENVEVGKTYTYHNPSGSPDNGKPLKVIKLLSDDRALVNIDGEEVQTNVEYLTEKKKAKKDKEEKPESKGLTAKQKKLPASFQKAILKKMGKSAPKDEKDDKKVKKSGLTAGQKKLPEAMQKAILAKQKKK